MCTTSKCNEIKTKKLIVKVLLARSEGQVFIIFNERDYVSAILFLSSCLVIKDRKKNIRLRKALFY